MEPFQDCLVPRTAVLELTYKCNHNCLFCSVPWKSPQNNFPELPELNIQQWCNCIDTLVRLGIRHLAFSGGEPLLKKGLPYLIRHAGSHQFYQPKFDQSGRISYFEKQPLQLTIISNGALINETWAEIFKDAGCNIVISLPGLASFSKLTGGGNYQLALQAINLLSRRNLFVTTSICVTKTNLPELFETIAEAVLNGADYILLNRFVPGGAGLNHLDEFLDASAVVEMLDIAESACRIARVNGSLGTEIPKCLVKNRIYNFLNVSSRCSGGVSFFAVDPSGKIRPCNHSPRRLGSYREIETAIKSSYWQQFKCKDFLPTSCSYCPESLACDGGCREAAHILYGSFQAADPTLRVVKNCG